MVRNMFKVNNKNTNTHFTSVSIADFEQINVSWVAKEAYVGPCHISMLFRKQFKILNN